MAKAMVDSMSKQKIRLVISDMDGTLIDSERAIAQALCDALVDWGIICEPSDFLPYTGMGDDNALAGVAKEHGVPYTYDMNLRAYEIYDQMAKERVVAFPWSERILRLVKSQEIKLAIASAAGRIRVLHNLKRLGFAEDYFDAVITANDVKRQKPDPEIFLRAIERVGVDPSEVLVLEDSTMGVRAAKAAGARCLAVTTSYSADELIKNGADYVTDDFSEFEDLLKYNNESEN